MILIISLVIGLLYGVGGFLMLKRDMVRVVFGLLMISNATTLAIIAAGLTRGRTPIYPLPEGAPVSDPLVQALALTAFVITFAVSVLILALVYRVYQTHGTLDVHELRAAEEQDKAMLEQEEISA